MRRRSSQKSNLSLSDLSKAYEYREILSDNKYVQHEMGGIGDEVAGLWEDLSLCIEMGWVCTEDGHMTVAMVVFVLGQR